MIDVSNLLTDEIEMRKADETEDVEKLVNHPDHYKKWSMECIDEMLMLYGPEAVYNFCICSAHKYRYRVGSKSSIELNMGKADWFMRKAKELKEKYCVDRSNKDG